MADDKDVLLEMFKQYHNQSLHHQVQRSTTANMILILAGVAIGLITFDQQLGGGTDGVAAMFLLIVGLFGVFWSAKQYERYSYYGQKAKNYRNKLDASLPEIDMKGIENCAAKKIEEKHPRLYKIPGWRLWQGLYVLITALGFIVLCLVIVAAVE